jgi:methylated-DNA-[protein]-cysteine S-methyltransferase
MVLFLRAEGDALRAIWIDKDERRAPRGWLKEERFDNDPVLAQAARELREYWAGERRTFSVPWEMDGTEFQCAVWKVLTEIPYGETRSYAEIAKKLGKPLAVRAVGAANGANPIPIIVPCHRVLNSSGKLGGYSAGLDVKRALLVKEGVILV